MAPFVAWYRADGQGRPGYHPRVIVALVMYCYCKGTRSSRAIEMATFDDVGARVICGNLHPDHSTLARFVSRHQDAVKGLLTASLVACAKEGLVSVEVVAGDGTKIKASASRAANATAGQLEEQIAGLEAAIGAEVAAWAEQARAEDAAEDALFADRPPGGGPGNGGGPGTLARTAEKLVRRHKARAKLAAEAAARQEQAGAQRAEKISKREARAAAARARAGREAAAADARAADYQRRAAAKAAAGRRTRPDG